MRRAALLLALALAACASSAAVPTPAAKPFSMRMYYLALLRQGPKWSADRTPAVKALLAGHMANMKRLGVERKLLVAGPFEVADDAPRPALVGLFVFDVASKEEAERLVSTDPTIAAGHFAAEVIPWYGPSGLTYDGRDVELRKNAAETR